MKTDIARYCPDRPLPPYSYVPGLAPHPVSDPQGHSFGVSRPPAQPLDETSYSVNDDYLYAIDLFNHGFYWEAHEEWERLWHAAGRTGATADFLKGLIKLAAAGVKLREGRAAGVAQHTRRAAELLTSAAMDLQKPITFGLCIQEICGYARNLAENSAQLAENQLPDVGRQLAFVLRLEER